MKLLYKYIPKNLTKSALTIGNFDGVHLGHQALIKQLCFKAKKLNLPTIVVLFEPQPGEFFLENKAPNRLSSLREKLNFLKKLNIDYVYCIHFNKKFALMEADKFANDVVFEFLKAKYILVGHDFHFGRNRSGNVDLFAKLSKNYEAEVDIFPDYITNDQKVSSTQIRLALNNGDLNLVKLLLGRDYSLCGRVIQGDKRGREWGIPTANIKIKRKNLILQGVYCVKIKHNGKMLNAVANIGCRPTVDGKKLFLEVHILDFNENLYGEFLEVSFLHKLRDESKFSNVDTLIKQIKHDIEEAQNFFAV